ncbi:MAG TPA: hypothetical protein VJT32_09110 [bacterium]|nr:hypothetical protein [bacterium]
MAATVGGREKIGRMLVPSPIRRVAIAIAPSMAKLSFPRPSVTQAL